MKTNIHLIFINSLHYVYGLRTLLFVLFKSTKGNIAYSIAKTEAEQKSDFIHITDNS